MVEHAGAGVGVAAAQECTAAPPAFGSGAELLAAAEAELPAVLSVKQVAKFLGLSLGTTYARLRNGSIPARQVGRRWLVSREALVAWLSPSADDDGSGAAAFSAEGVA